MSAALRPSLKMYINLRCNSLDLVSHINYNDAKEVSYQYNKVGNLVKMDDWLGTTTFEVDLLGQLKKVTDHKGNVVEYTYDAVGNQTSVTYPDETTVTKTYDNTYNLTKVTDAENQNYLEDKGRRQGDGSFVLF